MIAVTHPYENSLPRSATGNDSEICPRGALRFDGAVSTRPLIAVMDGDMLVLLQAAIKSEALSVRTGVAILLGVVPKIALRERAFVDSWAALRTHDIGMTPTSSQAVASSPLK